MLLFLISLACTPTCEQTCDAILSCEDENLIVSPGMNLDECESACSAQETVYNSWEDEAKQQAFDELKTCIVDSECSALNEGACYDEEVYIW